MRKYRNICIDMSCNLKCDYCGGSSAKVDTEKVCSSLDKVFALFGPEEVCFKVEGNGEITLYPDIIAYLENKCLEGYLIEVLSNGTQPINENTKLNWTISLDGHTEKMNVSRGLNQKKIDDILNRILMLNAEIQCVYSKQSIEEINEFLSYLERNNYKGMLNIFPIRDNHGIGSLIDYSKLKKSYLLPDKTYFDRWTYMYNEKKRNFVCDFYKNGYMYLIANEDIKMIKCNCTMASYRYIHEFGEEKTYNIFPCTNCITHFEYNNSRFWIYK